MEASMDARERAERAAKAIGEDIGDRRGLKWEWRKVDDDIRAEILGVWAREIEAAITEAVAAEREACEAVVFAERDYARGAVTRRLAEGRDAPTSEAVEACCDRIVRAFRERGDQ